MKKENPFYKTISTHIFVLKLAWKIDKKRIFMELLDSVCYYFNWLAFSVLFMQFLFEQINRQWSYSQIMVFLWGTVLIMLLILFYQHYFKKLAKPVSDVRFYDSIYQLLYNKSCQVDLRCYEDSEFYNQYMLSIQKAQTLIPETLANISGLITRLIASIVVCFLVYRIDHYAILFLFFPMVGNLVFNRFLIARVFQIEKESIAFKRMADYVNRTIHLAEYAKEMRLTKVFRLLKKQYDRSVAGMHEVIEEYSTLNCILYYLRQFFTFAILLECTAIYAGYRTLESGTMTLAQFAVFQSIMTASAWIILYFSEDLMTCVKNSLVIDQIQGFLDYVPAIPEDTDGIMPVLPIHSIEFSHVWFGYKEGKYILRDIHFKIENNSQIAIVGYNGAGKSTLMKLLLRFYDPDKGQILVNGIDIRNYNLRAYRKLFSTAFQDGKIFADTVEENIKMGRKNLADETICAPNTNIPSAQTAAANENILWHSLQLSGISKEVSSWKQKEKTILTREFSKEGQVLSGGQSQKIIAARAFAKNSPIAIFDEPSSALDPIAEHELFTHIRNYGKEKMLFFISHRLSSVKDADIVFFLENGRITERGNHQELMSANKSYSALYKMQAQNYLADTDKQEIIYE